jgi:hypothetical protein
LTFEYYVNGWSHESKYAICSTGRRGCPPRCGFGFASESTHRMKQQAASLPQWARKLYDQLGVGWQSDKVTLDWSYVVYSKPAKLRASGESNNPYIEAHHLRPVATISAKNPVKRDPRTDFAVLCANCHRMIHRTKRPWDLKAFKKLLNTRAAYGASTLQNLNRREDRSKGRTDARSPLICLRDRRIGEYIRRSRAFGLIVRCAVVHVRKYHDKASVDLLNRH